MAHHHHQRGAPCIHGLWATDDFEGHHHHKRRGDCLHGMWATDSINGHHHHMRGGPCIEHCQWATGEEQADNVVLTRQEFADSPAILYDLSNADTRSYLEVEQELDAHKQP
jgi:hypothetical protein